MSYWLLHSTDSSNPQCDWVTKSCNLVTSYNYGTRSLQLSSQFPVRQSHWWNLYVSNPMESYDVLQPAALQERWLYFILLTSLTEGLEKVPISQGLVTVTHLRSYTNYAIADITRNSVPIIDLTESSAGIVALNGKCSNCST